MDSELESLWTKKQKALVSDACLMWIIEADWSATATGF